MKTLLIHCVIIYFATGVTLGQSQKFSNGFKEGFCYNSGIIYCDPGIIPAVPMPRLNESSESYQDGFNRGFQVGLDLQRLNSGRDIQIGNNAPLPAIPNLRFNGYVPQSPVEAMKQVGMYKEALHQARVQWVQNRINGLYDLAYSILSTEGYDYITEVIISFGNELKSRKDLSDITNNRVVQVVSNALRDVEYLIYEKFKSER